MRAASNWSLNSCSLMCLLLLGIASAPDTFSQESAVPTVLTVERQPLEAATNRLVQALQMAGSPLSDAIQKELRELAAETNDTRAIREIQRLLDPLCLAAVQINAESRVRVLPGPVAPTLDELGWTNFLVKVVNEAGVTAPLICTSPNAQPMVRRSSSAAAPKIDISPAEAQRRWLDIDMVNSQPLRPTLSGLPVEYRILQLYSRDAGKREANLEMSVGQGTQDLGFRNELPILFTCRPSVAVPLEVLDENGKATTCSLLIRDAHNRVYPNPSRRLAPDLFFHEQVYRAHGESLYLAPGKYNITVLRGPEYMASQFEITVNDKEKPQPFRIEPKRWIHMAKQGWFSGDHHVHAAGCAHYENPTEGVRPEDMLRHIVGEDLNIGCVLSWGPCWYYQKQFFDGKVSNLSRPSYLMRYDVEVSGFPSSHAGHLCLLNLTEDDYPGTKSIEEWPTWTLPVLKWGKEQGGVVGYSHSGWGLALPDYLPDGSRAAMPAAYGGRNNQQRTGRAADKLPDYAMPRFDGIGANEFIVTTAHDVCDFISAVDTPSIWELNIWYHTLNCGFNTRISGETDFPCIYGERVGLGRSYVALPNVKDPDTLEYGPWVEGLRDGRSYVGDGLSHLTKFEVNGFKLQGIGTSGQGEQLKLAATSTVVVKTTVAAMLPATRDATGEAIAARRLDEKPYWHLERARVGLTRKVPVELVVNGHAVARQEVEADGSSHDLQWEVDLSQSSWLAVRILPSLHTNPIFVEIGGEPIRASRKSAQWCREAVDACWSQKREKIRESEMQAATEAYDHARRAYESILKQCKTD